MSERVPKVPSFSREGKPRDRGLTIASDMLAPFERGFIDQAAEYIDYVKIGLSLPLVADRSRLIERIRYYHDLGIRVMSGGTLMQVAVKKGFVSEIVERLRSLNFDVVEISESSIEISSEVKKEIIEKVSSVSMDYIFEVGRKDPKFGPSLPYLVSKTEEAFDLKSPKVIIEAGEIGRGVGIYDQNGDISWEALNDLVGRFGPPNLIFEAPSRSQRVSLILEFGPSVNLANIPIDDVILLEMQRLGLTTETLGLAPSVRNVEGSPASKFVYHLIKSEHPIDQATLIQKSGLPKRTLQAALSYLVEKGLVREVSDLSDLRKHKYTPR
ncbi:MAG: phosphosulfolactate synthase [archaeon]|nr:phosphosulfolactate synthase [archaeon]